MAVTRGPSVWQLRGKNQRNKQTLDIDSLFFTLPAFLRYLSEVFKAHIESFRS